MKTSSRITAGAAALAAALVGVLAGCEEPKPDRQELITKGNWHYWRGEYIEAIGPYNAAYEADPADADVLFQIGQCHFYLGNYREAGKWYRQAIKSFPGHREAAAQLAEANRRLPDFAPQPGPDTGPDVPFVPPPQVRARQFIELARTYESQGDADRALENYKNAVKSADNQAFTHAELGRYYLRTGRNAEALEQLKLAHGLNPAEPGLAEDLTKLGVQP